MIGQTLGSFQIESELGSGAMGIVYKGRSLKTGEHVAIKIISKEALVRNAKAFDRFIREIDLLEQFKHPNIVRYRARGRYQGVYYYAMEYIEGSTLEAIIKEEGPITWDDTVRYAIQLCSALQYAHEQSVIHRDLKPSNLMIAKGGKLKLTDFGIAKDIEGTALTAPGRTLGTLAYMSPEQVAGSSDIGHKSDLYGLGVVLYEMLTGETPFKGDNMNALMLQHATAKRPRPSAKTAVIPVALDDLIVSLMAIKPANRPHDAALVAMKLEEILNKALQGETLPMVWPDEGSSAFNPTRDHMMPDVSGLVPAKAKTASKKGDRNLWESIQSHLHGGLGSVLGLVAALAVVGGLIAYLVWPPSAEYLFAQADKLMASDQRTDWIIAQGEFLDPLDQRFPNHPYRSQTEAWHDKIALTSATNRAELIRKANTESEELFLAVNKEATAAAERGEEVDAAQRWRDMESRLKRVGGGREERGWMLLARSRAEALEKSIKKRRQDLSDMIFKAEELDAQGAEETATNLRRQAVDRFAKYTDVLDLVNQIKLKLPAANAPKSP